MKLPVMKRTPASQTYGSAILEMSDDAAAPVPVVSDDDAAVSARGFRCRWYADGTRVCLFASAVIVSRRTEAVIALAHSGTGCPAVCAA